MDAVDDTSASLGGAPAPPAEESPSLLVVALDIDVAGWARVAGTDLRQAVAAVLVLVNAHLAQHNGNEVAFLGFDGAGARYYYPEPPAGTAGGAALGAPKPADAAPARLAGTMYRPFAKIGDAVVAGLDAHLKDAEAGPKKPRAAAGSVAGALSLGLCFADRRMRERPGTRARALVVSVSDDDAAQHVATMNCIFAAQKLRMPLDVANLRGRRPFLQQAADFTGGVYVAIREPAALAQYLLSAFAADPVLREHVTIATQHDVDFSAVCFVTKEVVEVAHVCSVCLTIMKEVPADVACPVCGTHFDSIGAAAELPDENGVKA